MLESRSTGMSGDFVDSIACLYSATVTERDGSYVVDVPDREVELGDVEAGSTVRIAILRDGADDDTNTPARTAPPQEVTDHPEPPVEEGEVRSVTIDTLGDQGDGIAKVERGFIVIVPGTQPGDIADVKITDVKNSVAFAEPVADPEVR